MRLTSFLSVQRPAHCWPTRQQRLRWRPSARQAQRRWPRPPRQPMSRRPRRQRWPLPWLCHSRRPRPTAAPCPSCRATPATPSSSRFSTPPPTPPTSPVSAQLPLSSALSFRSYALGFLYFPSRPCACRRNLQGLDIIRIACCSACCSGCCCILCHHVPETIMLENLMLQLSSVR